MSGNLSWSAQTPFKDFSPPGAAKSGPRHLQVRSNGSKSSRGSKLHPGMDFDPSRDPGTSIVNASRIPPRPPAGQRLEVAGQQLEAWKAPPDSSWRRLGASKSVSWRALGGSLSRLGGSWRALGASWAVLEASWEVLGRSWRHIRGVLEAPRVVLEPSWKLWKPCWSHMETKWLPKWGPKGSPIELQM